MKTSSPLPFRGHADVTIWNSVLQFQLVHMISNTLVSVWVWGIQGLGEIDMQYISMTELLWWGHEVNVCAAANWSRAGLIRARPEPHSVSIQPSSSVNVWSDHKSAASRFLSFLQTSFSFLPTIPLIPPFSSFLPPQFSHSSVLLMHFKAPHPWWSPAK